MLARGPTLIGFYFELRDSQPNPRCKPLAVYHPTHPHKAARRPQHYVRPHATVNPSCRQGSWAASALICVLSGSPFTGSSPAENAQASHKRQGCAQGSYLVFPQRSEAIPLISSDPLALSTLQSQFHVSTAPPCRGLAVFYFKKGILNLSGQAIPHLLLSDFIDLSKTLQKSS